MRKKDLDIEKEEMTGLFRKMLCFIGVHQYHIVASEKIVFPVKRVSHLSFIATIAFIFTVSYKIFVTIPIPDPAGFAILVSFFATFVSIALIIIIIDTYNPLNIKECYTNNSIPRKDKICIYCKKMRKNLGRIKENREYKKLLTDAALEYYHANNRPFYERENS